MEDGPGCAEGGPLSNIMSRRDVPVPIPTPGDKFGQIWPNNLLLPGLAVSTAREMTSRYRG